MNVRKFKKALLACGKTYDDVASLLGCKRESLYKKFELNRMSSDEITKLSRYMNLYGDDLVEIFYPELFSARPGNTRGRNDGQDPESGPRGGCPAAPAVAMPCPEPEPEPDDACPDDADERERMYRTKKTYAHDNSIRVTDVLLRTEKEFYDFKDMMEISGRQVETCRKMIRKIKAVSDVFGISGVVHRVDYIKYLQTQLDNGAHRETEF